MKIKNSYLNESDEEIFDFESATDIEVENQNNITIFTSIISSLVKDEWEAIEGYNGAVEQFTAMGYCNKDVISILQDIIQEEYIHIGQLEKTLKLIIPQAEKMDDGEEEAEETLEDHSGDNNDDEEYSDDVPEDVVNKINFKDKIGEE